MLVNAAHYANPAGLWAHYKIVILKTTKNSLRSKNYERNESKTHNLIERLYHTVKILLI